MQLLPSLKVMLVVAVISNQPSLSKSFITIFLLKKMMILVTFKDATKLSALSLNSFMWQSRDPSFAFTFMMKTLNPVNLLRQSGLRLVLFKRWLKNNYWQDKSKEKTNLIQSKL